MAVCDIIHVVVFAASWCFDAEGARFEQRCASAQEERSSRALATRLAWAGYPPGPGQLLRGLRHLSSRPGAAVSVPQRVLESMVAPMYVWVLNFCGSEEGYGRSICRACSVGQLR
eukprot:365353-Chlamydomonas_euryale.AAC.7